MLPTMTVPRRRRAAAERKCLLFFCDKPQFRKGLCEAHYFNVRRYGSFLGKTDAVNLFARFVVGRNLIKRVLAAGGSGPDDLLLSDLRQYVDQTDIPYSLIPYQPGQADDG